MSANGTTGALAAALVAAQAEMPKVEPAAKGVAFGEVSASGGLTMTELECDTLTRTLLMIAEKRGIDVEAIAATVAANRAAHAAEPAAHASWLRLQLVRAERTE